MNSAATRAPSEATSLDGLVEQWAAVIGSFSDTTVESILLQAENVCAALQALQPHGPNARQLLRARARLSQPMLSKLEAIGRYLPLMRPKAHNLPPSINSLYILTRKPYHQFLKAAEIDLRGMSRTAIRQLVANTKQPPAMGNLLTVKASADITEEAKLALTTLIRRTLSKIAEEIGIELQVSGRPKR
jgi:hypothetical protein